VDTLFLFFFFFSLRTTGYSLKQQSFSFDLPHLSSVFPGYGWSRLIVGSFFEPFCLFDVAVPWNLLVLWENTMSWPSINYGVFFFPDSFPQFGQAVSLSFHRFSGFFSFLFFCDGRV